MADRRPRQTTAAGQKANSVVPLDVTDSFRTGAKALFHDGSRVLLIEEQRADGSTFWTLPGGGIRPAESLRTGLHRELGEELRCVAHVSGEVGHCLYRHRSRPDTVTHYTILRGTLLTAPDPNPGEGIIDYDWVDPEDPPKETLYPFQAIIEDY